MEKLHVNIMCHLHKDEKRILYKKFIEHINFKWKIYVEHLRCYSLVSHPFTLLYSMPQLSLQLSNVE